MTTENTDTLGKSKADTSDGILRSSAKANGAKPTPVQLKYLQRGLGQPGGKLPLFDHQGQEISHATIRACVQKGWAEPWFDNPVKPDWLVCKLTSEGAKLARSH